MEAGPDAEAVLREACHAVQGRILSIREIGSELTAYVAESGRFKAERCCVR